MPQRECKLVYRHLLRSMLHTCISIQAASQMAVVQMQSAAVLPCGAWACNPTLFRATTKGVLRIFSRLMDSMVCCSKPCIMSTTRMAMSHKLDPRDLKLEKDS